MKEEDWERWRRKSWRMLDEESQNLQPFIPGLFAWVWSLACFQKACLHLMNETDWLKDSSITVHFYYDINSTLYHHLSITSSRKIITIIILLLLYKHYHYRILKSCLMIWTIWNSSIGLKNLECLFPSLIFDSQHFSSSPDLIFWYNFADFLVQFC